MRKWPEEIPPAGRGPRRRCSHRASSATCIAKSTRGASPPVSHWTGRGVRRVGHRYDYIFASREFETDKCEYLTDWIRRDGRGRRLSDHAPVEATLSVRG